LLFSLFALCPALPVLAQFQQLLTNGSFETGNFSGWKVSDKGSGSFSISTPGARTPTVNGFDFATALNAQGGHWYAVCSSDNPGTHALIQDFTVPGTGQIIVSFQMFVNDQSAVGPIIDPTGLDDTTGGLAQPNDNQHARVDILKAGAADFSTASGDVVKNLYLGADPSTLDGNGNVTAHTYHAYTFDLTSYLKAGQTYRLRFATVDNLSALNLGVDNVSLTYLSVIVTHPIPISPILPPPLHSAPLHRSLMAAPQAARNRSTKQRAVRRPYR
jgi:hypothetical protein